MQDQIMDMLLKEEEISWKTIIYDLVKTGEIDPWDVNITLLTQRYIQIIKKMQVQDLPLSGKILLAAALLLKIKSTHLVENDITRLDALLNSTEELEEMEEFSEIGPARNNEKYVLIPKNPQPRNRKVSVQDLVNALQRAMVSKKKVLEKLRPEKFALPERTFDIMDVIYDTLQKINYYAKKEKKLTFSRLLPPHAGRQEKVFTFIPLLHLENLQEIELEQEKPFDEIEVKLSKS